ncbi:MAG: hypothetical protein V3S51_09095 [Dehalococcoidia bacterium]
MARRVSVGKRLADDMEKRGIDALFSSAPAYQPTSTPARKFEKATFYFDPDNLAQLEKVWLHLMGQGIRCNKSEIISILLKVGLEAHEHDPANSLIVKRLTGKRRRS